MKNNPNEMLGKIDLELNFTGNKVFLNFWDSYGKDVVCEMVDGKLILSQFDEDGYELPNTEITFAEFVELVKKSVKERKHTHTGSKPNDRC